MSLYERLLREVDKIDNEFEVDKIQYKILNSYSKKKIAEEEYKELIKLTSIKMDSKFARSDPR